MVFKCRLCGKNCGRPQGRGAHEAHCAKEKGAKIVGFGVERHFITADGGRIEAPNSKNTNPAKYNLKGKKPVQRKTDNPARARAEEKARKLAAMMGKDALSVKEIHRLYSHLVGNNVSASSVSGFLRLHPETFKSVDYGVYQVVNGAASTALAVTDHPSEKTLTVDEPHLTPQEQYIQESDISHRAVTAVQKAAALLQFSALIEDVGASQALAMVAGMSKIGRALNGNKR